GSAITRDILGLGLAVGIALLALQQTAQLNPEAAVFPRTIAMAMAFLVFLAIVRLFLFRQVTEELVQGSIVRMAALPLVMLGSVYLLSSLNFLITAPLMGLVLTFVAQHDHFSAIQRSQRTSRSL
ncbi:MAG: C4-dicarboxylate ABC transporter permease, partial [Dinoroseobacter sp.]|nr:C4-dicarboxylate ABC transporter permease [Dinoroseobacter sp.]